MPLGAAPTGHDPASGSDARASASPATPAAPVDPEPAPSATRPPACAQPNVAAATLDPVVPDTPPLAQQQGLTGDVTVLVSLDERSHLVTARILKSPSILLNDAALRAARASSYRTEVRDCRPVAADYAFIVEFSAQ